MDAFLPLSVAAAVAVYFVRKRMDRHSDEGTPCICASELYVIAATRQSYAA